MQLPPSIPNLPTGTSENGRNWLLASLFLAGGFLLTGWVNGTFFELLTLNHLPYGAWIGGGPIWFYDFRFLCLIPSAVLIDRFMDRRDALAMGAIMTAFGILTFLLPFRILEIPSQIFFALGVAMFEMSLLAYLGDCWSNGPKRLDAGYALFLTAALIGSFANWFLEEFFDSDSMVIIGTILLALLLVGTGVVTLLMQSRKWLPDTPNATSDHNSRMRGPVLVLAFAVLAILFFVFLDGLEIGSQTHMQFLGAASVILFIGGGVLMMYSGGKRSNREQVSLLVLFALSLFFWVIYDRGSQLVSGFWGAGSPFEMPSANLYGLEQGLLNILLILGGWGITTFLFILPNKGKEELGRGIRLLVALMILFLIPFGIKMTLWIGTYIESSFAAFWQVLYLLGLILAKATFFVMIYKFTPPKSKTLGVALFFTGYFVVKYLGFLSDYLFDYQDYYIEDSFDLITILLGILMVLGGGLLLYVRIRKWDT